jgi:hypothetical protein
MIRDASMGNGRGGPAAEPRPNEEKLFAPSTVLPVMDPEASQAVPLEEEIARLQEARAERDELLIDLEETRVSIMWLEAERRSLAGRGSKRRSVARGNGTIRAAWAAAGAIAFAATLWVLR